MSQNWRTNLLEDSNRSPFARLLEYHNPRTSTDDVLEFPPKVSSIPQINLNGMFRRQQDLGKSLAGLHINHDNGLSNDDASKRPTANTESIGTEFGWLPLVPETRDPFLPLSFVDGQIHETPNDLACFQASNAAGPSSPWGQNAYRSEGRPANLHPTMYSTQRSPAATHSQYSDSLWETVPSPSADDSDTRPMPDEGSASMQSYNNPHTGIWLPEHGSGQDATWSPMRNGYRDDGSNFLVTPSLPRNVQEVFANADAATPFGTKFFLNGGIQPIGRDFGVEARAQMTTPSLLLPTSSQDNTFPSSPDVLSAALSGDDIALDLEAPSIRHSLKDKQPSFQPARLHNPLGDTIPRVVPYNIPVPTPNITPTSFTNHPSPIATPPLVADASTPGLTNCSHRDCPATFTGGPDPKNNDALRRHLRNKHRNTPKPVCPECNTVFVSGRPDNLKRHFANKHPGYQLPAPFKARRTTRATKSRRPPVKRS